MPKVVLGKTPEQLQAEEAKRQRELEAAIEQKQMEQQRKLNNLKQKQKTSKYIVIALSAIGAIALLTFGTYNTFFKHILTQDEVLAIANSVGIC